MKRVAELLSVCGTTSAHMPATLLYNEGWLLRLVLDWFHRSKLQHHALSLLDDANWFSEALLPSQFAPRHRGDELAESRTHADGVLGHFAIGSIGRADISLNRLARQFVVVEAKMFSSLSAGTTRAKSFDQAARNVACMAHLVAGSAIPLSQLQAFGFVVVAPKEQIDRGVFGELVTARSIERAVQARCELYGATKNAWSQDTFLPTARACDVSLVSWESIIDTIEQPDPVAGSELREFYARCIAHNRPRYLAPAT